MSEKPQEEFEYNLKNLWKIAIWKNIANQIWDKTKTAVSWVIWWWAVLPLLATATWIAGWFGLWWLAAAWLWVLAERNLQKESGQSFWAGLWTWWKLAASIWLANIVSSGVFSFLFAAFWTYWALNILYFYLVHWKAKAKEIIEEQTTEEKPTKIVEKIEEVVDNLEESLDILFDWKEQKMSLKYVKNKA